MFKLNTWSSKQQTTLHLVLVLLAYQFYVTQVKGSDPSQAPIGVTNADMAYQRSLRFMGFDRANMRIPASSEVTVVCKVTRDDQTPFVHEFINGNPVWDVEFTGVELNLPQWSLPTNRAPMTFHVILDSSSGRLLRVYSILNTPDPDIAPEPPTEEAEAYMLLNENIVGVPLAPPPITFFQALNNAIGSQPLCAKEIDAILLNWGTETGATHPVWSIIGRGNVHILLHDRGGPEYLRNRGRTVVDAVTGEPLSITSGPLVKSNPRLDSIWKAKTDGKGADSTAFHKR